MRPRGSLAGRLLAAAVTFLVAAAAVVWTVRLIVSVWLPLVVIVSVLVGAAGVARVLRHRRSRW